MKLTCNFLDVHFKYLLKRPVIAANNQLHPVSIEEGTQRNLLWICALEGDKANKETIHTTGIGFCIWLVQKGGY